MNEWVICKACGFKYRARSGTCPRCEHPTEEGQALWVAAGRGEGPPLEASTLRRVVPLGLLVASVGAFVFLGPLGGRAAGWVSMALVLGGLGLGCGAWVWSMALAWREGLGWVFLVIFLPIVSVLLLRRWKVAGVQVAGTALVAFGALAPAGFFQASLSQKLAVACEARGTGDRDACVCIGLKTVGLMSLAEQRAPVDLESPQVRELMLTAGSLCLKDRLVTGCVAAQQGSTALCSCLMEGALIAFTPGELTDVLARASAGAPPPRYAALRADCQAKLETKKP